MSRNSLQKSDWLAFLFFLVGLPVAFIYGGILVGLVVLVVCVAAFKWSKNHKGLFPTNGGK